jgi:hypothetical protein
MSLEQQPACHSRKGLVESKTFSLTKLLHDVLGSDARVGSWQDFEALVVRCCQQQDPQCIRNKESDPDVTLTNGYGIEAKSIANPMRGINLNSASPDPKTFYVIGHLERGRVKHVAIISGANFYCPEIEELKKVNTRLQNLSNNKLRYRTRIMWQIVSPFETWGRGSFIVDKFGRVTRC